VSTESKIRAALSEALKTRGKQAEISKALDVHPSTVKRWADGAEITPPVVTLLDWYFFGVLPAKIARMWDHRTTLDFDEGEWEVIGALARREGVTEASWIAGRIRSYLAYVNDAAKPCLKVAEDDPEFRTGKENGASA
jgi:DNA-binding MarR family transcriptional regulator